MIKYSRQREAIVQYLTGRTDHPSAESVYQALRQTHPNISLGTVYRNLGVLEENGQLMRIPMDNGSDRFDPNVVPHYHFLCRKCGCLQDVPMTALDSLNQLADVPRPAADHRVEARSGPAAAPRRIRARLRRRRRGRGVNSHIALLPMGR